MKKIILVFLIIFLTGCQSNTNEIDETSFNYEASYEGLNHSSDILSQKSKSETGVYQIAFGSSLVDNGTDWDSYLLHYSNDTKKATIVNDDPSNNCSMANIKACSGYLGRERMANLHYYNNKIYYAYSDTDIDTGSLTYFLMECELDGSNQKVVYKFPVLKAQAYGLSLVFHKGYIYHTLGRQGLKRIDMRNWQEEQFSESLDNAVNCSIFFVRDSAYIVADSYEVNKTRYEQVLLEITSDNSVKIVLENTNIWTMNDEILIGFDVKDETTSLFTMNLDNLEKSHLMNDTKINQLFLNDKNIVVTTSDSPAAVYLYDLHGELLDVYHEEEGKKIIWTQGFVGENVLIQSEKGIYFLLPIVDQVFGEAMVIEVDA